MDMFLIIFGVIAVVVAGNVVLAILRRTYGNTLSDGKVDSMDDDDYDRFIKEHDDLMFRGRQGLGPNSSYSMFRDE